MKSISAEGIAHVKLIDASPIGITSVQRWQLMQTYMMNPQNLCKNSGCERPETCARGIFPTILECQAAWS